MIRLALALSVDLNPIFNRFINLPYLGYILPLILRLEHPCLEQYQFLGLFIDLNQILNP